MNEATIVSLTNLEYELIGLIDQLKTAARIVAGSGVDGAFAVSRDLHLARRLVRRALLRLDGPLTEAAKAHEQLAPPPF